MAASSQIFKFEKNGKQNYSKKLWQIGTTNEKEHQL